jgi:hypothetical protein
MLLRMFSKQKRPIDTGPLGTSPTILSTPDRRPEVVDVQSAFHILFRYYKHGTLDRFAHEKPTPSAIYIATWFKRIDNCQEILKKIKIPAENRYVSISLSRFLLLL